MTDIIERRSDALGPAVPADVMTYLHAYGDSRADDDGLSGLRLGEAILALRRWAGQLQAAAEIEALRNAVAVERERLECVRQALPGEWRDSVPSVAVATLVAEIEALRKDAARYRWLRDNPWPSFLRSIVVTQSNAAWDTAIDASMKAQAEREAT